jgi:hypothetical protein
MRKSRPKALQILAAVALAAVPALAQGRDFLSPDEVTKLRLTQEPDARLELYTTFAQLRMEMLRNYFANNKSGRSAQIHDALEEYTKIIEAIDTVADDALRRNISIEKGIAVVEKVERQLLADLERFEEIESPDRTRWDFVLDDAMEATRDSLALAAEDVRDRKVTVAKRDAAEKQEREEMLSTEDVKARRQQDTLESKQKAGRKLPSLRRAEDAVEPQPAPKKK